MMINANELRIGNLFATILGEARTVLTGEDIDCARFYIPIPLTPEWLVKLGGTQHYEDQPELWQIGLFVFNLHNQYGLCQWDQECQCIIFGTIHYKYVHQLQNLYFALTGEELTIKE